MNSLVAYKCIQKEIQEIVLASKRACKDITLVVVTKNYSFADFHPLYLEGVRDFAENRLQEATQKMVQMPLDCQWHFIGTLQSNKIAQVISSFQLIHSVATPNLAQKISRISQMKGIQMPILLQVNTSGESTKQGLSGKEWEDVLEEIKQYPSLRIEGLMTMAPLTTNKAVIRSCFRQLFELREKWKPLISSADFRHLSMGMSNDYSIAIEEGATLLRIGSAIFTQ
jgi:pyridoxal phosphate enzyme (YggS family)